MISIKDQQKLLIEIAKRLKRQITAYAIGGTAMMFIGFKDATKDVDIVFLSEEDRRMFKEAAKSLGYSEMDSAVVYGIKKNSPEMIHLGDSRLDLFLSDVIDFTFSEAMQKRAAQIHQFAENLILKIADLHDIIIMKCATERKKDEDDVTNIIRDSKIKWPIVVGECKNQVRLGREKAIMMMGYMLERVKKHGINIPKEVLDELWTLLKEQIMEKERGEGKG